LQQVSSRRCRGPRWGNGLARPLALTPSIALPILVYHPRGHGSPRTPQAEGSPSLCKNKADYSRFLLTLLARSYYFQLSAHIWRLFLPCDRTCQQAVGDAGIHRTCCLLSASQRRHFLTEQCTPLLHDENESLTGNFVRFPAVCCLCVRSFPTKALYIPDCCGNG